MRERRKPMERTTRRQPSMPRHFGESIRRPGGSLPPPGPRLASLRSGVVVIPEKPKTRALYHAPLPQKRKGPDSAVHRGRSSRREMSIRAGWGGYRVEKFARLRRAFTRPPFWCLGVRSWGNGPSATRPPPQFSTAQPQRRGCLTRHPHDSVINVAVFSTIQHAWPTRLSTRCSKDQTLP